MSDGRGVRIALNTPCSAHLFRHLHRELRIPLAIAAPAAIYVCFRLARPVPGLGILLPGFAAALVAIGMSWLLSGPAELSYRPPVAFMAGVLRPLVGADLGETGGE